MVQCSNPGGDEIFNTYPDQSRGSPIFLYDAYCVCSSCKAAGVGQLPTTPFQHWTCKYKAIRLLPTMFQWNVVRKTLSLSSVILEILHVVTTAMHHLTTGILSEKFVVRGFHCCANIYLHKPRWCSTTHLGYMLPNAHLHSTFLYWVL